MTRYGRVHVAEPLSSLRFLHFHDPAARLAAADHEPPIPVLDQQNLRAQGIDVAAVVPGGGNVDALGSCVANATTAALADVLTSYQLTQLGIGQDAAADEEFAIGLYHAITTQPGTPASGEWPPDDQGSSGLAACTWLEQEGWISSAKIARDAEGIVSLMQHTGLIVGQPFLTAWETPGPDHFIDGDGSMTTLQAQLRGGVAGGHETYWAAVDPAFTSAGDLDPARTVIRFRNSWGTSWGDHGAAYAHLSTFIALAHWCDFRALVA